MYGITHKKDGAYVIVYVTDVSLVLYITLWLFAFVL